jgi:hypothetical protein
MRRVALAVAVVLAGCWACAPATHGSPFVPGDSGIPIGGGGSDAGDGGSDAGDGGSDAGDGGSDAGGPSCVALTLAGVPAIDGCQGSVLTSATGTVDTGSCTIDISLSTATTPCLGSVSGASDAFDGGCEGSTFRCTSTSLPGTLDCVFGGSLCSIKICDAGASCP